MHISPVTGAQSTKRKWQDALDLAKEGRFDEIDAHIQLQYFQTLRKIRNETLLQQPQIQGDLENLWHSIIGGMVTKEKRQCSSRNGRSPVASSLATTSKSGQIAMLSNQKLRDPLCHLNAQDELWSLQTTRFKNASEQIQHCWQRSEDDSPKSTSTTTHSSTPSRVSSHPTDSPETSLEDWWCEDDWYWENGGET